LPTYEYRCDSCDEKFDVVQSFHDEPLTACPTCGSPVRKVFGSVGIVFKGSGFYKTDSRNGGPAKTSSEPSTTPATESDGSGSSSDDKTSPSSGDTAAPSPKTSAPSTSTETKSDSGTPAHAAKAPSS
jgi:putative FmdB family regulatory protein